MCFNILDIKTYKIDKNYKQCFSNIKNSIEYSFAIDYMLENFDENIDKYRENFNSDMKELK